jgi:hypothetical protein
MSGMLALVLLVLVLVLLMVLLVIRWITLAARYGQQCTQRGTARPTPTTSTRAPSYPQCTTLHPTRAGESVTERVLLREYY